MKNPYQDLDGKAFWRTAIANRSLFDISELWQPKTKIKPSDAVATYGSCFAQHIGRALQQRDYTWLVTEEAPNPCSPQLAQRFNYGVFSSRTGNIYTTSLLRQWVSWASKEVEVPTEVWQDGEHWRDPFRPAIEPEGFASVDELLSSRSNTLQKFRLSIEKAKFFVFTLGLTESWRNVSMNYEYPMCPGTIAGEFDPQNHQFVNQGYEHIKSNLDAALAAIRDLNPDIRIVLTVSPVPLTATASGQHVLVATMHSKSTLRAVAGQLAGEHDWVDYFPSYEIINSPAFGGIFFEPNKRSVNPAGVKFVMKQFFASAGSVQKPKPKPKRVSTADTKEADEVCEEALLQAFEKQ